MPWRRCRGRRLWRERIAPPYEFQDEFYFADFWPADALSGTLLGWWRPEKLSAYLDGAGLTSWADYSGHSRTATPRNPLKPIVKKATRNGLDIVRFAGSTDNLGFTTTGSLSDWTVFVVCGSLDVATNAISYAVSETAGGIKVGGSDATHGFLGEYMSGFGYRETATKPTAWGVDCLTPGEVYRDNVLVTSALTGAFGTFGFTDLGGLRSVANLGVIGDIGEVLIYDATLSADERAGVSTYLKHRWNTP